MNHTSGHSLSKGVHCPRWLTTRDAHGQHDGILRAFRLAMGLSPLPAEIEALLRSIEPTTWHGSKVSGIDLSSDFVWIDDQPLKVEIDALQGRNLLSRSAPAMFREVGVTLNPRRQSSAAAKYIPSAAVRALLCISSLVSRSIKTRHSRRFRVKCSQNVESLM